MKVLKLHARLEFLLLSVEKKHNFRGQRLCILSVCVNRKCVYSMYSECVSQSEENIQREWDECKKKRYCPVGLRQS